MTQENINSVDVTRKRTFGAGSKKRTKGVENNLSLHTVLYCTVVHCTVLYVVEIPCLSSARMKLITSQAHAIWQKLSTVTVSVLRYPLYATVLYFIMCRRF